MDKIRKSINKCEKWLWKMIILGNKFLLVKSTDMDLNKMNGRHLGI
jgi:hypothetical protein